MSGAEIGLNSPFNSLSFSSMVSNPNTESSIDKEKGSGDDERHVQVQHAYAEERPDSYHTEKYGALSHAFQKLFSSGVEERGVQRVPEDERDPRHTWNKCVDNLSIPLRHANLS